MMPLTNRLQDRIQSVKTLPILPEIAFGIVELGRDPDAGVEEYARLAEMDAYLSSKLMALTNSSWFGLPYEVTNVKHAISLLGITNVRALSTSNCLAGLHSSWTLNLEDSRAYWEASLCKGVAARLIASVTIPKRSAEAFAGALFQDIAVGLLASLDDSELASRLRDPDFTVAQQVEAERSRFGMDHAQCARLIAETLGIPKLYIEMLGCHHQGDSLAAAVSDVRLAHAVYVASLLPHDIRAWKSRDMEELRSVILRDPQCANRWLTTRDFVSQVQEELSALVGLLSHGTSEPPSLAELLMETSAENALLTERIVAQAATLNVEVSRLSEEKSAAEVRSKHDPLTGFLNRRGFLTLADQMIAQAKKHGSPFAVAMFDLDRFKEVNDTYGHDCGDMVLNTLAERVRTATRQNDAVCRWGGDEIVVLFPSISETDCVAAVERIRNMVARDPLKWHDARVRVSMSAGIRWIEAADENAELSQLINEADQALYEAKRIRRGSIVCRNGPMPKLAKATAASKV